MKKISQKYFFAENQGVKKQSEGILRTSLFMSLSPDKLQLDQNCSLFLNIPSSEDSWYKCLVTVHTLMGWEHHSVNTNRTLLASLHTTIVKATKICNSQGLTNQDTNLLYVTNLAYKLSQNNRG